MDAHEISQTICDELFARLNELTEKMQIGITELQDLTNSLDNGSNPMLTKVINLKTSFIPFFRCIDEVRRDADHLYGSLEQMEQALHQAEIPSQREL